MYNYGCIIEGERDMKAIYKKTMKAIAWIVAGLVLLVFALLFLFGMIFFTGVWYKETFM